MIVQRYLWNLIIWLDQGINTLFAGDPDETVSSRAAKAKRKGHFWGCALCWLLDRLDPGHCDKTIELDEGERLD